LIEHELVVAESQRLPAGGADISYADFTGDHVGKLLFVIGIFETWVEVGENHRAFSPTGRLSVFDYQAIDQHPFRHVAGVTEVVLTVVKTTDNGATLLIISPFQVLP